MSEKENRTNDRLIRVSMAVGIFFIAGHVINYSLYILVNRRTDPDVFGIFYTCIATINILFSASSVLVMMFAAHLSRAWVRGRDEGLLAEINYLILKVSRAVMPLLVVAAIGMFAASHFQWIQAPELLLLTVAVAVGEFAAETLRCGFQASRRLLWFGGVWVLFMVIRFALGWLGLVLSGKVWGILTGMLVATVITCAFCYRQLSRGVTAVAAAETFPVIGALPFVAGLGGFTLLTHADTLLAYFMLLPDQLGIYTASALLPKAVLVAVVPVIQVLVPSLAAGGPRQGVKLTKAIVLTVAMVILAWAALVLGRPLLCSDGGMIMHCVGDVLGTLMAAIIPLAVLRILLVADLTLGSDWGGALAALPGLVVLVVFTRGNTADVIPLPFVIAGWGSLGLYCLVRAGFRLRRQLSR